METNNYLEKIEEQFKENENPAIAKAQEAYMRNRFFFPGLKTTKRRELQKPFLKKEELPSKEEVEVIIRSLGKARAGISVLRTGALFQVQKEFAGFRHLTDGVYDKQ